MNQDDMEFLLCLYYWAVQAFLIVIAVLIVAVTLPQWERRRSKRTCGCRFPTGEPTKEYLRRREATEHWRWPTGDHGTRPPKRTRL